MIFKKIEAMSVGITCQNKCNYNMSLTLRHLLHCFFLPCAFNLIFLISTPLNACYLLHTTFATDYKQCVKSVPWGFYHPALKHISEAESKSLNPTK